MLNKGCVWPIMFGQSLNLKMTLTWLILSFVILLSLPGKAYSESMTVAMGNVYRNPELIKQVGVKLEDDLRYIYSSAGINVDFVYLPSARAVRGTIQGKYDALDLRIGNIENEPDLIKLDVPLADIDIFLFSTGSDYYSKLSDIEDKIIVANLGNQYAEKLKKYKRMYRVNTSIQGAMMLAKGRVDVWVASKVMYLSLKDQFPEIKIASPVISHEPLYHYIHKSKSHLLPRLEKAAKQLVQDKRNKASQNSTPRQ
ncbi:transporter substrate-binding domain-containing protein [Vibrio sp. S4M6]|uniref:substrate-binding periplasmic protein n=1 Tax=Vibrio sinus TaxID=2946865 RepID=UPI002029D9C9|nr:transporter substrate-binding domain-containing protein [Vibrio sinus]MCL9779955.1 transporter substrate-binding domain-containing protein [Vibrio sinus]